MTGADVEIRPLFPDPHIAGALAEICLLRCDLEKALAACEPFERAWLEARIAAIDKRLDLLLSLVSNVGVYKEDKP